MWGWRSHPSLGWLVAFRVLSGGTAAAIIPLSMAWIGDAVPYDRRQATLARLLTGTILGMIGGQIIGGIFADTLGWRLAFVFLAGIYATVALMFHLGRAHMPPDRRAGRAGATVSAQIRTILEDPWARTIVLISFLEGAAVFGAMAFIPTYLNARFGLTLTAAGAILGLYGIGGPAYTFVATGLVRAAGERGLAAGGGLLLGCAFGYVYPRPGMAVDFRRELRGRTRLLHAPRHTSGPCDPDGSFRTGNRGLAVRLRPLLGSPVASPPPPGSWKSREQSGCSGWRRWPAPPSGLSSAIFWAVAIRDDRDRQCPRSRSCESSEVAGSRCHASQENVDLGRQVV